MLDMAARACSRIAPQTAGGSCPRKTTKSSTPWLLGWVTPLAFAIAVPPAWAGETAVANVLRAGDLRQVENLGAAGLKPMLAQQTPPPAPVPGNEAQDREKPPYDLEPVVVTGERTYAEGETSTATKFSIPLRDIPQSIQVVPRAVLEDRAVVRADELTDNVSGVQRAIGFGTASGYYIRGFFTSYDSLRNGFRDIGAERNVINIERVEFLKGPAAVLYGSGFSPGGVVNTVTKKPLETPRYATNLTVGSYSFYRPSIDLGGPLTKDGTLLYRFNASYENSGSYQDFTRSDRFYFAPAFTWKITPQDTLTFELEQLHGAFTFLNGLPNVVESLQLPVSRYLSEPGLSRTLLDTSVITYTYEHKFSEDWKVRQGFNTVLQNYEIGSDRVYVATLRPDGQTVDRTAAQGPQRLRNYTLQNEVYGRFDTGSLRHNLLFGVELSRFTYNYIVDFANLGPLNLFNPRYGASARPVFSAGFSGEYGSDNLGFYLQDLLEVSPNLKVLLGGRFDLNTSFAQDGFPQALSVNRIGDSRFSPRVGLLYRPADSTSLYFNWSTYFNPQFFSRSATNTPFRPETSEQYEIGVRQDLGSRLAASLAFYFINRQNVLTADPDNQGFSVQTGEQTSRGVEFDLSGRVLPGWNIIATYALTDAFVSKDNFFTIGERLVGVPVNSASLFTTYELQEGGLKGLGLGFGALYTGDRQATLPNSYIIPSYIRLEANVFYRTGNLRLALNFKNLTDVKSYDTDLGFRLFPGEPFTVLGSLALQY